MRETLGVTAILAVQLVCTAFFVWDIASSAFGIRTRPLPWNVHELLEVGSAAGLVLGVIFGALVLARTRQRQARAEARLRAASAAFRELLEQRFGEWGLTPAERDVALFSIKGLSTGEIAALRATSEGTVKAQSNAIYRKAGVSGRPQLLSLFLEELMDDETAPCRAAARTP